MPSQVKGLFKSVPEQESDVMIVACTGVTGIGVLALVGGDPAGLLQAVGNSFAGPAAKVLVSFPLIYHYLGGVRHFVSEHDSQPLQSGG